VRDFSLGDISWVQWAFYWPIRCLCEKNVWCIGIKSYAVWASDDKWTRREKQVSDDVQKIVIERRSLEQETSFNRNKTLFYQTAIFKHTMNIQCFYVHFFRQLHRRFFFHKRSRCDDLYNETNFIFLNNKKKTNLLYSKPVTFFYEIFIHFSEFVTDLNGNTYVLKFYRQFNGNVKKC
jgi:hypothetical protein